MWFKGVREVRKRLATGREYVLFGKPSYFRETLQMTHPEVDPPETVEAGPGVRAVYPLTEKLRHRNIGSKQLHGFITAFLANLRAPLRDTLPDSVVRSLGLMSLGEAIRNVHIPPRHRLSSARLRLKFEEVFYIQTDMLMRSRRRKADATGALSCRA